MLAQSTQDGNGGGIKGGSKGIGPELPRNLVQYVQNTVICTVSHAVLDLTTYIVLQQAAPHFFTPLNLQSLTDAKWDFLFNQPSTNSPVAVLSHTIEASGSDPDLAWAISSIDTPYQLSYELGNSRT